MDEPTEKVLHGLTWPEAYAALRPLIGERWGIGDELYLTRKLSGGRTAARLHSGLMFKSISPSPRPTTC